jgi:hypothetical protein
MAHRSRSARSRMIEGRGRYRDYCQAEFLSVFSPRYRKRFQAPIRSRMPPCSDQSRPSPSGDREDAASLDRSCARRLRDSRSGRKNACGAVEPKNGPKRSRRLAISDPLVLSEFQPPAVDKRWGLTPPPASNQKPYACDRRPEVWLNSPIANAGSKGLPVFRTPKHRTNNLRIAAMTICLGVSLPLAFNRVTSAMIAGL